MNCFYKYLDMQMYRCNIFLSFKVFLWKDSCSGTKDEYTLNFGIYTVDWPKNYSFTWKSLYFAKRTFFLVGPDVDWRNLSDFLFCTEHLNRNETNHQPKHIQYHVNPPFDLMIVSKARAINSNICSYKYLNLGYNFKVKVDAKIIMK